ncbi:spermidine synthase [Aeromicrobium sp. CF3.5]|uniref:spermidine synthase n=1 Tax=Aeromicrobium sp. CF3.5 TaxID=3373078 RepID=UPI003EE711DD
MTIVRDGTGYTVKVGGNDQSFVDLDDPYHLMFDYLDRMATVITLLAPAGERMRFVHIGGAAMSLPRFVAASRPTSPQIVLEPAEHLTALVREELPLPRRSGIKVRPLDGRTGLAAMRDDHADVIVLDAFDGPQVPAGVVTAEFFAEVGRVLAHDGTLLVNLGDRAPFAWSRRVLAGLREVLPAIMLGGEAATLKGRRHGNVLVVASRANLPVAELTRAVAGSPFPYTVLAPVEAAQRFAGGAPFTDADSEPSPVPERGSSAHFG